MKTNLKCLENHANNVLEMTKEACMDKDFFCCVRLFLIIYAFLYGINVVLQEFGHGICGHVLGALASETEAMDVLSCAKRRRF